MHPLDPRFGDQNHLAGLHAGISVTRHHVRLNHDRLPGAKRIIRYWTRRAALGAENWRQIASAVAMQKIVDDCEAGVLDDTGSLDDLRRSRARLEDRRNRIEGSIGRRMPIGEKPFQCKLNILSLAHEHCEPLEEVQFINFASED